MKKRILTAVLAAALVTGTCAATVSAKEEKTYTIGICQLVQHDALDAATKGFEDAITEKMGDSVKFDEQNAQGDSNTCSTIINGFVSEGADLILANATASLQAAAAGTSDIPILGTAVTEYGVALGIDDFDGTVGGNISGTSDLGLHPLSTAHEQHREESSRWRESGTAGTVCGKQPAGLPEATS